MTGNALFPGVVAHIDLFPTLLEACRVEAPRGVRLDGRSLMPLLVSENTPWADRTLYFQWHRGDAPELYRNCAARSQRYKLVNGKELYDMAADPPEKNDIATEHPDIVAEMRRGCEEWFRDVSSTRGYDPPRIHLGTPHENPSVQRCNRAPAVLTRQDWRGAESWHDGSLGYWEVKVARSGAYDIVLTFPQTKARGVAQFRFNNVAVQQPIGQGITTCRFHHVPIRAADGQLHAYVETEGKPAGVTLVTVERL